MRHIAFGVGEGWKGGEETIRGWRKGDPHPFGINDKLSPVVTWKIKDVPNKLVAVAKEISTQNVKSASCFILVAYDDVEKEMS